MFTKEEINLACKCYPTLIPRWSSPIHQQIVESFSIGEEGLAGIRTGVPFSLFLRKCPFHFTVEKLSILLIYAVPIKPFYFFSSIPTHYFPTNDWHDNLLKRLYNRIYIMAQKKANAYDWIRWCMSRAASTWKFFIYALPHFISLKKTKFWMNATIWYT